MFGKKQGAMIVAEFMGTFVLTSAVYAVIVQRLPALFVAGAAGATLGLVSLTVGAFSGAQINPAVTIGLWSIRKIQTAQAAVFLAVQFLGAAVAWRLNEYFLGEPLQKLAQSGMNWKIFTAEAVGAFVFTFGIASAVYQGYKGLKLATTFGASLGLGILVASIGGNGVLNPAVALGIQSWNTAYLTGPLLGALVGMNLYALLFAPAQKSATASARVKLAFKKVTKKRK